MKFFFQHLMPWPHVPANNSHSQAWVTYPREKYDPELGVDIYEDYLSQYEYAERLGFDGVCVNEHHQTAYGNMPSPNIMAAVLAVRTKRVKIAILGNAIPLRHTPQRIAEELAMLDVLSNGRIICGFVRGIGPEYHSFSMNPTQSRERFQEAHDLIVRAWMEPGPFEFYGKHYKFRYVNPWPRTVQQPHPPIWIPSQGSVETIDWVAEKHYTYLQTYSSIDSVRRVFDEFRAAARRHGYEASPQQLGWALPIYLAETEERAYEEAKRPIEYLFNDVFKMPPSVFFPPGYLTPKSMSRVLANKKGLGTGYLSFEDLVSKGYVMVGTPSSVRERLAAYQKEFGFGNLLAMLQFGTLPHHLALRNIELFGKEVIPYLRDLGEHSKTEQHPDRQPAPRG
ncbi:MAG: LLM class flavin-dependent oxidoreductase [Alicyclobacillus macrosporangiidus]|uniref:LLM class flavin-dependent oxidoreductase n=1 Tax=Alicyclobacillus macrosporangiidus TaxID=392015 RepID=UPI0026EBC294|nr:LLM class flavin-dependent oxidoreductase [Alicyclobacillus macrosporangiidus]MCL6599479.1 LLM class flavin-dependent oxidoreductase [Alicyclobacillus macrosporangiidus]